MCIHVMWTLNSLVSHMKCRRWIRWKGWGHNRWKRHGCARTVFYINTIYWFLFLVRQWIIDKNWKGNETVLACIHGYVLYELIFTSGMTFHRHMNQIDSYEYEVRLQMIAINFTAGSPIRYGKKYSKLFGIFRIWLYGRYFACNFCTLFDFRLWIAKRRTIFTPITRVIFFSTKFIENN